MAVPFENLDIHYGKKIKLENTYDKIVKRHRGGFCYELNGLFNELLKTLGFKTKLISAKAYDKKKVMAPSSTIWELLLQLMIPNIWLM